ncbi:MAG: tyrosine-type recombinase/integrase [Magnetococcales bacterium]|nr:tyrosine-type recombinase/integrase [Magnetococcales bacterium]
MQGKITKRMVDALQAGDKDEYVWDSDLAGFGLKITPAGRKIYLVQYRVAGRTRRVTIGPHGPVTPDQARAEASKLLGQVASGQDPAETRAAAKTVPTLAEAMERFFTEHAESKNKPRTVTEYRKLANGVILPQLGAYRIDAITRSQVAKLHHEQRETPYQGNRALALLSVVFNWMEAVGLRPDHSNPTLHVKRYKEQKRERMLSDDDLARLGQAITEAEQGGASPHAIAAIRLLVLTGARLNEILTLKWAEVDFQSGALRLSDSKTGAKSVALNPPALELLATIPRLEGNDHVIAGKIAGHSMVNINRSWRAIREAAGMPTLRIHDLRHAYASVGASMGMSLPVIGKLLGHTQTQTTARYAHLSDDPLKKATRMIGERIQAAMEGKSTDNVIPLSSRVSTGG